VGSEELSVWSCCNVLLIFLILVLRRLGSTGEVIVVMGDSAGGNLATALTIAAIVDGIRRPDSLILCYPNVNMTNESSPRFVFGCEA
jgi:hormone-sensitive lipase